MAIAYKVLGQIVPSFTNTNIDLYTVPVATSTVCSTLVICNTSNAATYRVAIRPNGASAQTKHYIVYDTTLPANDSAFLTLGLSLATGDVVTVQASSTLVAFSLFGSEIS
jgi:hypothetical protein